MRYHCLRLKVVNSYNPRKKQGGQSEGCDSIEKLRLRRAQEDGGSVY